MILNWSAVIVGGLWLAVNREWSLLIAGTALIFFGRFILAFFMMIGLAFTALAAKAKWAVIRPPLMAIAFVYYFFMIVSWAVSFFSSSVNRPHGNVWPYILWAYAVSTIPWTDIARGETNRGAIIWVAGTQFGALAIMGSVLMGNGYQSDFGMRLFFVPAALLGMGIFAIAESGRGMRANEA